MNKTCIVSIETSCDDTSIALAINNKLIGQSTITSLNEHVKYGGIVPEIAARSHEQSVAKCLYSLVTKYKLDYQDITHVSYTDHPGLPGSLHVGKVFAKSLSYLTKAKLIPINHMMGHIFSYFINNSKEINYPFLALIVSGGHTSIYLVKSADKVRVINQTTDDAVGETLDKIGRALGLSYPGGISIDKVFDESKTNFKLINHYPVKQQFSFSGLKTYITNYVNTCKMKKQKIGKVLLASSSLEWIVDELMRKCKYYLEKYQINTLVIGGGVSANSRLRIKLTQLNANVLIPETKYCGDNAAMICNYSNILINKKSLQE